MFSAGKVGRLGQVQMVGELTDPLAVRLFVFSPSTVATAVMLVDSSQGL